MHFEWFIIPFQNFNSKLKLIRNLIIKFRILSNKDIKRMHNHWIRIICDEETEQLVKKIHPELKIVDWGRSVEFDIIINATSLGLRKEDKIELDFKKAGTG